MVGNNPPFTAKPVFGYLYQLILTLLLPQQKLEIFQLDKLFVKKKKNSKVELKDKIEKKKTKLFALFECNKYKNIIL